MLRRTLLQGSYRLPLIVLVHTLGIREVLKSVVRGLQIYPHNSYRITCLPSHDHAALQSAGTATECDTMTILIRE